MNLSKGELLALSVLYVAINVVVPLISGLSAVTVAVIGAITVSLAAAGASREYAAKIALLVPPGIVHLIGALLAGINAFQLAVLSIPIGVHAAIGGVIALAAALGFSAVSTSTVGPVAALKRGHARSA